MLHVVSKPVQTDTLLAVCPMSPNCFLPMKFSDQNIVQHSSKMSNKFYIFTVLVFL